MPESPTSPDDPLDLGIIEPGERQAWNERWKQEYLGEFVSGVEAQREQDRLFSEKVAEGTRRYNTDPEFQRRVTLLSRLLFDRKSTAIYDAIRAVVAIEEMDGGVLDWRIPR
jgi:hypothetical protein